MELFARTRTEGWDAWGNEVDCDIDLLGAKVGAGDTAVQGDMLLPANGLASHAAAKRRSVSSVWIGTTEKDWKKPRRAKGGCLS